MKTSRPQLRKKHRYQWVIDALYEQPSFFQKRMFGSEACYLNGRLVLALTSGADEPWRGILVPTSKVHHRSLLQEFNGLRVHPILRKWLYLPEVYGEFEETANSIVDRIIANDARIGVEPSRSSR